MYFLIVVIPDSLSYGALPSPGRFANNTVWQTLSGVRHEGVLKTGVYSKKVAGVGKSTIEHDPENIVDRPQIQVRGPLSSG